jgi:hypothetical protein
MSRPRSGAFNATAAVFALPSSRTARYPSGFEPPRRRDSVTLFQLILFFCQRHAFLCAGWRCSAAGGSQPPCVSSLLSVMMCWPATYPQPIALLAPFSHIRSGRLRNPCSPEQGAPCAWQRQRDERRRRGPKRRLPMLHARGSMLRGGAFWAAARDAAAAAAAAPR